MSNRSTDPEQFAKRTICHCEFPRRNILAFKFVKMNISRGEHENSLELAFKSHFLLRVQLNVSTGEFGPYGFNIPQWNVCSGNWINLPNWTFASLTLCEQIPACRPEH
jgi:hypothetical protein